GGIPKPGAGNRFLTPQKSGSTKPGASPFTASKPAAPKPNRAVPNIDPQASPPLPEEGVALYGKTSLALDGLERAGFMDTGLDDELVSLSGRFARINPLGPGADAACEVVVRQAYSV